MNKSPSITGIQCIKALHKIGFQVIRIKGSHHFLQHPDGRCSVVPVHRSEVLGRGLLSQILKDCEIDQEEFKNLL